MHHTQRLFHHPAEVEARDSRILLRPGASARMRGEDAPQLPLPHRLAFPLTLQRRQVQRRARLAQHRLEHRRPPMDRQHSCSRSHCCNTTLKCSLGHIVVILRSHMADSLWSNFTSSRSKSHLWRKYCWQWLMLSCVF